MCLSGNVIRPGNKQLRVIRKLLKVPDDLCSINTKQPMPSLLSISQQYRIQRDIYLGI
jgi:hypothetical protein